MRRTNCTLNKFQMKFNNAKIVIIFQPVLTSITRYKNKKVGKILKKLR